MIEHRSSNLHAVPRIFPAILITVLTVVGCGDPSGSLIRFAKNVEVPAVEPAGSHDAAIAWRNPPVSGEDAATIITRFVTDEPSLPGSARIADTSTNTGPIELVRLDGDRYFLGWIDNTNPPARLRWQIFSKRFGPKPGEPVRNGRFVVTRWDDLQGRPVVEFAAAYHAEPHKHIVLVAVLVRHRLSGETDEEYREYRECVVDGTSSCRLLWFTVNTGSGVVSEAFEPYIGHSRGVSVAAGKDGFLVASASGVYGRGESGPNRVMIHAFDAAGVVTTGTHNHNTITGKSDCAEDPQAVIREGDKLLGELVINETVDKAESDFADTVIAYNSKNDRYLVGYTTACNNSYFRARWVGVEDDGITVHGIGVDEDGEEQFIDFEPGTEVSKPPFQIADSASEPMLAYNKIFGGTGAYLAAYGSSETVNSIERQMFYAQFFNDDVSPIREEPVRLLEDMETGDGVRYLTFITGDIVTDPEQGRFYLVWAQDTHPTTRPKPEGYFRWFDQLP